MFYMTPDKPFTLLSGNALDILGKLSKNSVDCVVTSPPYYFLRKYDTEPVIWDNGINCEHQFVATNYYRPGGAAKRRERFAVPGPDNAARVKNARWRSDTVCIKCGAQKVELGQERYLSDYLDHLNTIFLEVHRVLKHTGTIFLNIGDTFSSSPRSSGPDKQIKNKDMCLVPQRLAILLQQSGFYIRSEIIWHKANPAPDPAKDRPKRSHETIWLLSKSEKYFWHKLNPNPGTVWPIPVASKTNHRAAMPLALAKKCLTLGCPERGLMLDPFMGLGTTVEAALHLNMRGIGIDLDAKNVSETYDRLCADQRRIANKHQQLSLLN